MRTAIAFVVLLLAGLIGPVTASDGKVYPLKPSDSSTAGPRGGWARANADKGGCAAIPFPTTSGKLRLKTTKDLTYVDLNDDGQFSDTEAVKRGGTVSVPIQVAGQPYPYPLMIYGSEKTLILMSMASLEAQVDGTRVRILDGNCNGLFGDRPGKDDPKGDLVVVGDKGTPQQLASYVSIGSTFHQLEVLDAGGNLRLTPYEGPVSQLSVTTQDGYAVIARLRNKENGFQFEVKSGASALALPGTYVVASIQLMSVVPPAPEGQAKAQPGVRLSGSNGGEVLLKEGDTKLAFGLPLKLAFNAVNTEKGVSVKDVNLVGAGGETYRATNTAAQGKGTLTTSLRSGAETVPGAKLSYG